MHLGSFENNKDTKLWGFYWVDLGLLLYIMDRLYTGTQLLTSTDRNRSEIFLKF